MFKNTEHAYIRTGDDENGSKMEQLEVNAERGWFIMEEIEIVKTIILISIL